MSGRKTRKAQYKYYLMIIISSWILKWPSQENAIIYWLPLFYFTSMSSIFQSMQYWFPCRSQWSHNFARSITVNICCQIAYLLCINIAGTKENWLCACSRTSDIHGAPSACSGHYIFKQSSNVFLRLQPLQLWWECLWQRSHPRLTKWLKH